MGSLRISRLAAFAAATVLLAGACTESTAIDDGLGEVHVTLGQTSSAILAQIVAAPEGPAGRVARDNIDSLGVRVIGIQLLPYCEEAGEQNGDGQCEDLWVPLDLAEPVELDLLALPFEGDAPIVIGAGSVPVGEYHKVRLFVDNAVVYFFETFTVGQSEFLGGEEYPLEIPSAQNSGIKVAINLAVEDDGEGNGQEVGLLFDSEATFKHVVGTGNGRVLMPPVLKARPMYQEQNQNP
jgi:hypothetical protein